MKVFISLKMNGRSEEDIEKDQNKALSILKDDLIEKGLLKDGEPLELISTIKHKNVPINAPRLWYLGASIQKLSEADYVYFYDKWWQAKGCWVEFMAANIYEDKYNTIYDFPNRWVMRRIEDILRLVYSIMDAVIAEEDPNNDSDDKKD